MKPFKKIKTKIKEVLEVNDCQNIYEVFKHT